MTFKRPTALPVFALLPILLAVPQAEAEPDVLPALIKRVTPGVVTVVSYRTEMAMPSIGTGFFVAPDRIVTARHVIGRADRAAIRTHDGKTFAIVGVLAEDRACDLVLAQLKGAVDGAAPLPLAADAPEVGERLMAVSSPLGLEYTAADGIVSAYRDVPGAGVSLQHTVAVSVGSSGCAILNLKGEVVGVQTGIITVGQKLVHAGGALNFAVSGKLIGKMKEGKLRTLAECRSDVPNDWVPPITKGIDAISLHALTRDDFTGALPFFEQCARENPDDPYAHFHLGVCLEKLGRRGKAIDAYERAIALDPTLYTAMNNLGVGYISRGDYVKAIAVLTRATAGKPDYAGAFANLAVAAVEAKRWPEALAAARAAVKLEGENAEARLNLGIAALRTGDRAEAARQQERLRDLDKPRAERLQAMLDEKPVTTMPDTTPTTAPATAPATTRAS